MTETNGPTSVAYSITSSGGGTAVTGTASIASGGAWTISGLNLTGLNNGNLTISVTPTDTPAGNLGLAVTHNTAVLNKNLVTLVGATYDNALNTLTLTSSAGGFGAAQLDGNGATAGYAGTVTSQIDFSKLYWDHNNAGSNLDFSSLVTGGTAATLDAAGTVLTIQLDANAADAIEQNAQFLDGLADRIGMFPDFVIGGVGGTAVEFGGTTGINYAFEGGLAGEEIRGDAGTDTINGGNGPDTIDGGASNDSIIGSNGADSITGGSGANSLFGENDNDTFSFDEGAGVLIAQSSVNGGAGTDTFFAWNGIGGGNVTIADAAFTNVSAMEVLTMSAGGTATVGLGAFANAVFSTAITVTNAVATAALVVNGTSAYNRVITATGGSAADSLTGGNANDILTGGLGNDTITGGVGADIMAGGAGSDRFVTDNAGNTSSFDSITDFNAAFDTIDYIIAGTALNYTEIDGSGFATLAAAVASAGFNGTIAHVFVYNLNNSGNGYIISDQTLGGALDAVIELIGANSAASFDWTNIV